MAIEILDSQGEEALTVRNLGERLSTGRGAIYHHVPGMADLLAAAADTIVADAVRYDDAIASPRAALRELALNLFDAIDTHPWLGAQLARQPVQPATMRIWTSVGVHLDGLRVRDSSRSDAGATLVNYILGSAAQFAHGARNVRDPIDRQHYLDTVAEIWTAQSTVQAGTDEVVHNAAARLPQHDDREQFLAGVDIIMDGIDKLI